MAVNIGPRIGIDGESEYRKQLNNIIQTQKTLQSEMKAVAAEFDDNADSQEKLEKQSEILTKQIDTQRKRVEMLEKGLENCSDKYGEVDTKTQKWKQAVYDATADLRSMEKQLSEVTDELSKSGSETTDFSDALDEMDDAAERGGDGFTVMKGAAADIVAEGISGAVGAVKDLAENIVNLAEETEEYRTMQAKMS